MKSIQYQLLSTLGQNICEGITEIFDCIWITIEYCEAACILVFDCTQELETNYESLLTMIDNALPYDSFGDESVC